MTCIIALEHEGKVYMGCDSASVAGWEVRKTKLPKVFKVQNFLIGYTDSFRMGQLIQHNLGPCKKVAKQSVMDFMVAVFVPALRKCLSKGGFSKIDNNVEEGGTFLVGYRGEIYTVYSDFQVNQHSDAFEAVGSGRYYALGAMATLEDTGISSPKESIIHSLEIAGRFCGSVSPPYTVLKL